MPEEALIDMSTDQAFNKFISARGYNLEEEFGQANAMAAKRYCTGCKEVLIKWRGKVPWGYCDVVGESSGEKLC